MHVLFQQPLFKLWILTYNVDVYFLKMFEAIPIFFCSSIYIFGQARKEGTRMGCCKYYVNGGGGFIELSVLKANHKLLFSCQYSELRLKTTVKYRWRLWIRSGSLTPLTFWHCQASQGCVSKWTLHIVGVNIVGVQSDVLSLASLFILFHLIYLPLPTQQSFESIPSNDIPNVSPCIFVTVSNNVLD